MRRARVGAGWGAGLRHSAVAELEAGQTRAHEVVAKRRDFDKQTGRGVIVAMGGRTEGRPEWFVRYIGAAYSRCRAGPESIRPPEGSKPNCGRVCEKLSEEKRSTARRADKGVLPAQCRRSRPYIGRRSEVVADAISPFKFIHAPLTPAQAREAHSLRIKT